MIGGIEDAGRSPGDGVQVERAPGHVSSGKSAAIDCPLWATRWLTNQFERRPAAPLMTRAGRISIRP